MEELLTFLVGVSPILFIMLATIGMGFYELLKRHRSRHSR